jgi:uncharacterized membrane protein YvlD (DUF360 family)
MSPALALLIKLGVRLVVFTGVFWVAAKKNEKIVFEKKWALPVVGLSFAILNTALYWALKPVMNIATLGAIGFLMPLIINGLLLAITVRIFQSKQHWFRIDSWMAMLWMAVVLTAAHGLLYLGLDYIPKRV